eukprot:366562-Chlamydomonas_euryale.AAC.12
MPHDTAATVAPCPPKQGHTHTHRRLPRHAALQIKPGAIEAHPDELAVVVHYEVRRGAVRRRLRAFSFVAWGDAGVE